MSRTVLVITYYWPPAGGVEVHRIVKFCKYLGRHGWEPRVLTVQGGNYGTLDPALGEEVGHVRCVHRADTLEPHRLFNRMAGGSAGGGAAGRVRPWKHTVGEFIRLNVFVPDARIGWYPYARKLGAEAMAAGRPDLLFSTAPPYTVHLVAMHLKKRFGIPWVADFRDPWLENYAYNTVYRFPWVRAINRSMERRVLHHADRVVTATPRQHALQSGKLPERERGKFRTITNGYDLDTLPEVRRSDRFFMSHFGWISPQRTPRPLLEALRDKCLNDSAFASSFTFRVIGRHDTRTEAMLRDIIPAGNLDLRGPIPHAELQPLLHQEQLMLVLVDQVPGNDLIITSKIFEILPTGNPMLCVGPPDGDTARILVETGTGTTFAADDAEGPSELLEQSFRAWKRGRLNTGPRHFPSYRRNTLTAQLAETFDGLVAAASPR